MGRDRRDQEDRALPRGELGSSPRDCRLALSETGFISSAAERTGTKQAPLAQRQSNGLLIRRPGGSTPPGRTKFASPFPSPIWRGYLFLATSRGRLIAKSFRTYSA